MTAPEANGNGHQHNFSDAATLTSSPRNSVFARGSSSNDASDLHPILPPEHDARTLVLCFDGTGDQSVFLLVNPTRIHVLTLNPIGLTLTCVPVVTTLSSIIHGFVNV